MIDRIGERGIYLDLLTNQRTFSLAVTISTPLSKPIIACFSSATGYTPLIFLVQAPFRGAKISFGKRYRK
jgi:hypothetical protein